MVIFRLRFNLVRIILLPLVYLQLPRSISPTIIASILKINIYVPPNFIMAYSLYNNAPATSDFSVAYIFVNDANDKINSTSASWPVTDALYILMNDALEKIYSILVSSLVIDVEYILVNDAIDKTISASASSRVTGMASILTNDSIENIDSTLASSLESKKLLGRIDSPLVSSSETNNSPANLDPTLVSALETNALSNSGLTILSVFPFSHISLPFTFNCVTSCSVIQVISYHSVLYFRVFISPIPSKHVSDTYFLCEVFLVFLF